MRELLEIRCELPTSDVVQLAAALRISLAEVGAMLNLTKYEKTRVSYDHQRCGKCRALYLANEKSMCPFCDR